LFVSVSLMVVNRFLWLNICEVAPVSIKISLLFMLTPSANSVWFGSASLLRFLQLLALTLLLEMSELVAFVTFYGGLTLRRSMVLSAAYITFLYCLLIPHAHNRVLI